MPTTGEWRKHSQKHVAPCVEGVEWGLGTKRFEDCHYYSFPECQYVSRHHGGPINGHPETPLTSKHYGIKRCPQLAPITQRDAISLTAVHLIVAVQLFPVWLFHLDTS